MMRVSLLTVLLLGVMASAVADEPAPEIHETFDNFDAKRFLNPIPNKYTEVRNGALWTRGSTGTAYPPMVFLGVKGKDLDISFRYRHLGEGGWVWFLVDGDDTFGSVDHVFRVKLLRNGVQLQVDGHTLDAKHPLVQKGREPDPVSRSYRLNEILPLEKVDLSGNDWHTVRLVFKADSVTVTLDESTWQQTVTRPGFSVPKHKVLWLLNGGDEGIEIDDLHVKEHGG